jgi:D-sedoheptulose 7-phosphate isomerase
MNNESASENMPLMHLDELIRRIPSLSACRKDILQAFELIRDVYKAQGKAVICGNGGSAADADHWASELLKGFCRRRPLTADVKSRLPATIAENLQRGLSIIPLTGFPAFSSAFANDVLPELAFAQLVWTLCNESDIFIGISTSGNARNVCAAAEAARGKHMATIALTGETGGSLKSICDVSICVPERETYRIQELHLPVYHCLSLMLEDEFFSS